MEAIINFLTGKKKTTTVFDVAKEAVKRITVKVNDSFVLHHTRQNEWIPIFPNDKHTPSRMGMGSNSVFLYFPKKSTPYIHEFDGLKKRVTILSGVVYDGLNKDNIWCEGDKFTIYPNQPIQPYTKFSDAYVLVRYETN